MYFWQTSENLANTSFTPGWLTDFILHLHDNSVTSRMRMLFLIVEICACGTCCSLPRGLLYFIQKPMVVLPLYDTVVIFPTGMKLFSHQCRNRSELALYYSFQSNNFWWHKFRATNGNCVLDGSGTKVALVSCLHPLHTAFSCTLNN